MVPEPADRRYWDLINMDGLPGQKSPNTPSEKVFGYHLIVGYGGCYYDPSYGLIYEGAADFQDLLCGLGSTDPVLPYCLVLYRPPGQWVQFV